MTDIRVLAADIVLLIDGATFVLSRTEALNLRDALNAAIGEPVSAATYPWQEPPQPTEPQVTWAAKEGGDA